MPLTAIKTSNLDTTNSLFFRNRIINGDMRIDQRNNGSSAVASGNCILDRFINYRSGGAYTAQRSTTAPAGFTNSMLMTNTTSASPTSYSFFGQIIEGFNIADFGFGTANAQNVTVSFWVNSSVAGIYSISLTNGNGDRAYPSQYTINTPNTWEYKTITIPGDVTGTWATNNTSGMFLRFNLGSPSARTAPSGAWIAGNYDGANGSTGATTWANTTNATFYVTGVQLEKGTSATAFEYRPYGTELQLCQRYFHIAGNTPLLGNPAGQYRTIGNGWMRNGFGAQVRCVMPVSMRAVPSIAQGGTQFQYQYGSTGATITPTQFNINPNGSTTESVWVDVGFTYTGTDGLSCYIGGASGATSYITFSAEL